MRLTILTDYGLRFLTHAALAERGSVSVKEVSDHFQISKHHMMKVAQKLAKAGWIEPVRGRTGGFRLAKSPEAIRIGEVVVSLEPDMGLVECLREREACRITPACRLPQLMLRATRAFLEVLDSQTLADLVKQNDGLIRILREAS